MAQYNLNQFVFLDETACDMHVQARRNGRAVRGERAETTFPLNKGPRYSCLPAVSLTGMVNFEVVQGGYDKENFFRHIHDTYAKNCILEYPC